MLVGISVILLLLAGWLLLDYGQWRYIYDRMVANEQRADLWALARETAAENESLRERLRLSEATTEIDKNARQEVQKVVAELQQEVFEHKQELEFYRGILATARTKQGLMVQGLRLERLGDSDQYRYKLVLTHVVKDDRSTKGVVTISFDGNTDAAPRKLELAELADEPKGPLTFEFKHFRRLEGTFALPTDFEPRELLVIAREGGKRGVKVERSFSWQQLVN